MRMKLSSLQKKASSREQCSHIILLHCHCSVFHPRLIYYLTHRVLHFLYVIITVSYHYKRYIQQAICSFHFQGHSDPRLFQISFIERGAKERGSSQFGRNCGSPSCLCFHLFQDSYPHGHLFYYLGTIGMPLGD